jgi:hypothetical protein
MREWVERVWQHGGEVLRMNPVRKSLEEVFIEVTAEKEAGSSAKENNRVSESLTSEDE